jgi:hypothetical protein
LRQAKQDAHRHEEDGLRKQIEFDKLYALVE